MQEEEMQSKKRKISDGVMRWSNSCMIDFLQAYKIEMEFKGLDFDAANVHSILVTGTARNFTH